MDGGGEYLTNDLAIRPEMSGWMNAPCGMPSFFHEALVGLFRNRPVLAPELIRDALREDVPAYDDARVTSADLTDIQPAEYRADLVIQLVRDRPILGIIIEVQLAPDELKRFTWPAYVINLRARLRCPVSLLVVTADDAVVRWASKPIDIGGGNRFVPWVLNPSCVPDIDDVELATKEPELAVLSAVAHGRDTDIARAVRIAHAAKAGSADLDAERSKLYGDLIFHSLSQSAREELQTMAFMQLDEEHKGIAWHYFTGRAEGETAGRVSILVRQLALRFGTVPEDVVAKIEQASLGKLDAIGVRLLTAASLTVAIGDL